jgi:hypothetical protein
MVVVAVAEGQAVATCGIEPQGLGVFQEQAGLPRIPQPATLCAQIDQHRPAVFEAQFRVGRPVVRQDGKRESGHASLLSPPRP